MAAAQKSRSKWSIVLVGTSEYPRDRDLSPLPAVEKNLHDLANAFSESEIAPVPRLRITEILNPNYAPDFMDPLAAVAQSADDVLLIYFAGHGILGDDGHLYLGLSTTTRAGVEYSGLSVELLKRTLNKSPSKTRLLILDCCYSGRALGHMGAADAVEQLQSDGIIVISSTAANALALAPIGARNTAFTGEFLAVLIEGDASTKSAWLDVETVFQATVRRTLKAGFPKPRILNTDRANRLHLVPNAAEVARRARSKAATIKEPLGPQLRKRNSNAREAALADSVDRVFGHHMEALHGSGEPYHDCPFTFRGGWTLPLKEPAVIAFDWPSIDPDYIHYISDIRFLYEGENSHEGPNDWRINKTLNDSFFFDLSNLTATEHWPYYLLLVDREMDCKIPEWDGSPRVRVESYSVGYLDEDNPRVITVVVDVRNLEEPDEFDELLIKAREIFTSDVDRWTSIIRARSSS